MIVDPATRWDSLSVGPGKCVRYRYTVLEPELVDSSNLAVNLKPGIVRAYRTNPGFALFRDNGVSMIYDYFDKAGGALGEIQVGPEDLNQ